MKIMKTSPEYYTIAYLHILPKVAAYRLKVYILFNIFFQRAVLIILTFFILCPLPQKFKLKSN